MEPIIQKFEVIVNDNNKLTHDEYDFDVIINSNGFSEDIWPNPANYNPFWSEFVLIKSLKLMMKKFFRMGLCHQFWTRFTKPIEWQDYNLVIKKVKVFNKSYGS